METVSRGAPDLPRPSAPAPAPRGAARRVIPVAPEGWIFVLVPLGAALLAVWAGWLTLGTGLLGVAAFMVFFFRDPERTVPGAAGAVLAPADGRVMDVRDGIDDRFVGPARRVSIFLSPLDVHVNRAPIGGRVASVEHRKGGFAPAYRPESERNEQTAIALEGDGVRVVVRQIAGVVARRVVCRVRPGDTLAAGDRFGLIRFGSRTDVVMPATARVEVRVGDRVRGGESIVAVLR